MIKLIPPTRETDSWGSGWYGASRGSRSHRGVDLACWPGSVILSPVAGRVTKVGYPYGDDLSYRYVQVTTKDGEHHRIFYIDPLVDEGDRIKVGDKIGIAQDIVKRYPDPAGMTPHIHYEIKDSNGVFLNPERNW